MTRSARTARPSLRAPALVAALVWALVLAGPLPAAPADPAADGTGPEHAYAAEGRSVEGGASLAQAPLIEPGIHRDVLASGSAEVHDDGAVAYYRIAVEDGQRVHAAATLAAPPYPGGLPEDAEALALGLGFLTAAGDACQGGGAQTVGESTTGDGPLTTTAVSDVLGPDGCAGEELFLRVVRAGPRAAEVPLPVEIQVAIQPAGIGGGAPAVEEEIEDDGASPVSPADTAPIALGRSFAAATPLEPGSYVLELLPGETGLVSVDVQEGQRLRWRTEVTAVPEEEPGTLALRVFDAVRSPVSVGGGTWSLSSGDRVAGGGMAAPVDLGNRSAELPAVRSAWLPGVHTVQLQRLQRPADADPAGAGPVTLILTLEVEGEVAQDAAEGTVLQLGDTSAATAPRLALLIGGGLLTLMALLTGVAGVLVLRLRRP
ncbi:hypothetical protein [Brachybacterium sp. UNK5269]|uniref:hypothetical protein n=1 Tax=Brachybacterium sp. UNK5269 TaxID=3408576 RepID=UPI003BAFD49E